MTEMTWIAPVYLRVLMDRAQANPEPPDDPAILAEALQYAGRALDGEVPGPEPEATPEPPLPDGEYARVEILGHDHHTGWVTESTRAGQPVMVVRDWNGLVIAEVPGHSLYRFVPLATLLKRPEPQAALPAGDGFGYECIDEAEPDERPFG
jgi:hypothetical protein